VRVGNNILVLYRNNRDIQPTMSPVLRAKLPVQDTTCSQWISPLSVLTIQLSSGLLLKIQHRSIAIDSCTPRAGTFGQSLSQVSGLNIAIIWVLDGANNAIDIGHGPGFFDLLWVKKLTSTPTVWATPE